MYVYCSVLHFSDAIFNYVLEMVPPKISCADVFVCICCLQLCTEQMLSFA